MFALTRPRSGRLITGVAIGFAERYRLPVILLRIVLVALTIISPFVVLLYLLLSISIPDEEKIASCLAEWPSHTNLSTRERFEALTKRLIARFSLRSPHATRATWISIVLLFYAAILEFPRAEGNAFYWAHPILTFLSGGISNVAPFIFYLSSALLVLLVRILRDSRIVYPVVLRDNFIPVREQSKMLGGIADGLSRIIAFDAAYIRVILILLNIFTVGLVGIGYLLLWYIVRSKGTANEENMQSSDVSVVSMDASSIPLSFRILIAILIALVGIIYIATENRWFFFNKQLFQGILLAIIGIAFVWHSLPRATRGSIFGLVVSSVIFLSGIYGIASAVGNLQIGSVDRFEIIEIIGAIAFAYVGIAILRSNIRRVALICALVLALSAALIGLHFVPPAYIAAIVRFYDFFYPIIFAALGLWMSFER